jgi:hypothetical protein
MRMTEESVQQPDESVASKERGKSTIEFPYLDLDNAVDIANAVHKLEGDRCDWNQLATYLNVASGGGGYRMRMLTAKTFNVLTYERGQVMLTDTGIKIADAAHEKRARFDAFMSVPLFKQLFDRFNGQTLPPIAAIERAIESLGVPPKQKERARQVFQRSAKQAGLFDISADRLSVPPGLNQGAQRQQQDERRNDEGDADAKSDRNKRKGGGDLPPFIQGLIDKLPDQDAEWTLADRAKWLTTAANIFDLMYKDAAQDGIAITLKGSTLSIDVGAKS